MEPKEKIIELRRLMKAHRVDAWIVPSTDPHQSEYPAERWKARAWLSGFKGSAGTVAVTQNKAGLWTDPRYHMRGETELAGSGIELYKLGLSEILRARDQLGLEAAVLVLNPPPHALAVRSDEAQTAVGEALEEARRRGVAGKGVTPFLLRALGESEVGGFVAANVALLEANARLAARIARAPAGPCPTSGNGGLDHRDSRRPGD